MNKCKDCEDRLRKDSIVTCDHRYECKAMNKLICYGEKLPKTSPRWCPKRAKRL